MAACVLIIRLLRSPETFSYASGEKNGYQKIDHSIERSLGDEERGALALIHACHVRAARSIERGCVTRCELGKTVMCEMQQKTDEKQAFFCLTAI